MDNDDSQLLIRLLTRQTVLALGVLVEGKPFVGQVPFAVRGDFSGLLIHVSQLAKHSRGLAQGSPFSALLQSDPSAGGDPFQLPRVTFTGDVRIVGRDEAGYAEAREIYLEKLPTGKVTFSLGDFLLCELAIARGRFVAGFGKTYNLTPGALRRLTEESS